MLCGALALLTLTGCNTGQPRLWRVALDLTPLRTIANPSCFKGNILPSSRGQLSETNFRAESEFVVWDGADQKQYLDIGSWDFQLGESPHICVSDLIEAPDQTSKVFTAQRNLVLPFGYSVDCQGIGGFQALDATESRQTQIVVTWSDYGVAPTGTVNLTAQYACVGGRDPCPNPNPTADSVSCNSQLNFVGRRIDFDQITVYGNNPQ